MPCNTLRPSPKSEGYRPSYGIDADLLSGLGFPSERILREAVQSLDAHAHEYLRSFRQGRAPIVRIDAALPSTSPSLRTGSRTAERTARPGAGRTRTIPCRSASKVVSWRSGVPDSVSFSEESVENGVLAAESRAVRITLPQSVLSSLYMILLYVMSRPVLLRCRASEDPRSQAHEST